jgi:lysophospholipase L1-like esterase
MDDTHQWDRVIVSFVPQPSVTNVCLRESRSERCKANGASFANDGVHPNRDGHAKMRNLALTSIGK